jgi:hypothetical protein
MAGVTGVTPCRTGLEEQKLGKNTKSGTKALGIDHRIEHGMTVREHE